MDSYLIDEQRKLHVCGNNPDCSGFEVEFGQYVAPVELPFTRAQREGTTILICGVTENHDALIAAALKRLASRHATRERV